eukprot:TRINITY_DN902_c1_g1_i12.p1 TRINITY_DN902_c1_g1~~TRINITY_DN902_c1_g1_i12.p1  ORF type:complete len:281 (-),score=62.67 TRINITY_DN902_c1_g1_i12:68-910(-)
MGRYSEAERLLQQALDIERAIFGEEHVHIAQTLNALGAVMLETCRLSHARSLLSQALRLKEQLLGTAAPEVAVSLNDLAVVYVRQEDLSSALPLYQRALDIRRGALGAAHPDTAQSLCNIAELRGRKGEFDEAARLYNEAVRVYECVFSEAHPDVAETLNSIANLYQRQGMPLDTIRPIYERVLHILCEVYRPDATEERTQYPRHPAVALALNDYGILHAAHGSYTEAERLLREALSVMRGVYGEHHPDVKQCCRNLADVCEKLGAPERAFEFRHLAEQN